MPLDVGVGIMGAMVLAKMNDWELTPALLGIAIFFALLPDLDALLHFLRKKKADAMSHEHRELFHYPLLFIPLAAFLAFLWRPEFALLCAALVFLHFIHDSTGIGWGVKWFYPFSNKAYKFFSDGKAGWSLKTAVFDPEEQRRVAESYGDPHWIRNIYFRPSPVAIVEVSVLILILILLSTMF